uniref:Uncharacterized protein n=1 Tax=Cucumis melo TaxID=3656 RepID=A0A9I9DL71_CUCME
MDGIGNGFRVFRQITNGVENGEDPSTFLWYIGSSQNRNEKKERNDRKQRDREEEEN